MKDPKTSQKRVPRNIRAASLGDLPVTAVPVSRVSTPDGVPLYSVDDGFRRAQLLKPCPILAKMTDILKAERDVRGRDVDAAEKEEVTKAVAVSRVIARNTLSACKKTASTLRIADFGNMPANELKQKADAYREEILRIKNLQEELATRINELPAKSKTLWRHAIEVINLDPTKNVYRYDYEDHVLYRIDPECRTCEANTKITEEKRKIDKQMSAIKTA